MVGFRLFRLRDLRLRTIIRAFRSFCGCKEVAQTNGFVLDGLSADVDQCRYSPSRRNDKDTSCDPEDRAPR